MNRFNAKYLSTAARLYFLAAAAAVLWYILFGMGAEFHADYTDSMLWGKASLEAGRTFDPDFYYTALLPFSSSAWYIPLIALFGYNYTTLQIGVVIFFVIFTAAVLFFFYSFEEDSSKVFFAAGSLLLLLSVNSKLREIMWGHAIYYSLSILFFLLGTGLWVRLLDRPSAFVCRAEGQGAAARIKRFLPELLLFALTCGVTTNGMQGIALYTVPIIGAAVLFFCLDERTTLQDRRLTTALILFMNMLSATAIGAVLLLFMCRGGIKAPYAGGASLYSPTGDWLHNLGRTFLNVLEMLGIQAQGYESMGSVPSVLYFLRFLLFAAICLVPPLCLARSARREPRLRFLIWTELLFAGVTLWLNMAGRLSVVAWRTIPFIGAALAVTLVLSLKLRITVLQRRLSNAFICGVLILSLASAVTLFSFGPGSIRQNGEYKAMKLIEQSGVTNGYGEFWRAHAIDLLSGRRIHIKDVIPEQQGPVLYRYQNFKSEVDAPMPEGKTFLILHDWEYAGWSSKPFFAKLVKLAEKTLEKDGYRLYIFDGDLMEMLAKKAQ